MKSPKMQGPSQEELDLQASQRAEMDKRNRQLAADEAKSRADKEADQRAAAAGKVGIRSLMSGDWAGFRRGGDLTPQ